ADGSIEVPADRLHAARYRLAAQGLPKSDADAQDEAERAPRFGASSLQEQQRFQRGLEIDLARSIQTLEAVELARVHLALPKVSPFLRDAPPATAAVLVRLHPGAVLQAEQVTTIQTLVAASVPRMKRSEVQVLDPSGMLLGEAVPEPVQSQRLALEQDLVRRALAVLTPWLGEDRVSVQVTATLDDSETRQTVERVQNVVVAGKAHPLEKSVRTTREPEGRIERIQAIVILGYDASAEELQRAGQLAQQALGLEPARGDSVNVYALPTAMPSAAAEDLTPAEVLKRAPPAASAPVSVPRVAPAQMSASALTLQALPPWTLAVVAALLALMIMMIWRRRSPPPEVPAVEADFDAE
ncbi:MAG: flagellar M-ring protein FliF C-terminal domain-containing protein, partial [Thiobacillus sp.]|nr:flagellar M-ring protein FliF C-terminal domain-containing protein [Thiobacillus sp.]